MVERSKIARSGGIRHNLQINPQDPRFSLHDLDSPSSIYSLAPEPMRETILECYSRMPKLLLQDESLVRRHCKPDERDDRLRMAFWDEYNRCTSTTVPREMSARTIISGITSAAIFNSVYVKNRQKVAWLITPVKSYSHTMQMILNKSIDRLLEVVSQPVIKADGEIDHKLVNNIIKIAQIVDLRVKGAIPQYLRVDQRAMNINVDGNQQIASRVEDDLTRLINLPIEELKHLQEKTAALAASASELPGAKPFNIEQHIQDSRVYALNNSPARPEEIDTDIDVEAFPVEE